MLLLLLLFSYNIIYSMYLPRPWPTFAYASHAALIILLFRRWLSVFVIEAVGKWPVDGRLRIRVYYVFIYYTVQCRWDAACAFQRYIVGKSENYFLFSSCFFMVLPFMHRLWVHRVIVLMVDIRGSLRKVSNRKSLFENLCLSQVLKTSKVCGKQGNNKNVTR